MSAPACDLEVLAVDTLAVEPSKELALHAAMLPPLSLISPDQHRVELATVAHSLRDYGTPVAAFRVLVDRFGLSTQDRSLVASTLIEPFVAQPVLAVQILARFVEGGLVPYGGAGHIGPFWNATALKAGIRNYSEYAPEGWPCLVACHLNMGGGPSGANVEDLAVSLGELAKERGWFDNYRDADYFFAGLLPTLRLAGFTPWECVRLSVATLSGAQCAHSGFRGFALDRAGRPYSNDPNYRHSLEPGKPRWASSLLAPLPALVVGKITQGLRTALEQEPYATEVMLPHPVLQQAGVANINDLVKLLGRQVGKDFVVARSDFAHRLETALRGAGALCGLSATTWDPATGFREGVADPANPVQQAQVDGQWVLQYLLGDKNKGIRAHAFSVLLKLCYGEGEGVDGLVLLQNGGLGRFPFGLERVLLETLARDPGVAKAA